MRSSVACGQSAGNPTCRLSRRELLKLGALAGAGVACGGIGALGGCAGPWPALPTELSASPSPALGRVTVAAGRGRDLGLITRQALAALGGMEAIVSPGQTVFIKPNFLTAGLGRPEPTLTGEITKVEVVVAVAEECLRAGAAEVIIGDGAQVRQFDWEELRTLDGSTHLAAEADRLNADYDGQVALACLNADSPEWDVLPAPRSRLEQIYVSSLAVRADRIISIPVLKTHRHAQLSLSLKNFMGVTPIARYGGGSEARGRSALHRAVGGPESCFLDIVEALRPDLAVIDGSIGCEGYGPWVRPGEGRTVDLRERLGDWLVLASTDLVAADATAARILGYEPARVRHIRLAHEAGLGQAAAEQIALVGPALDELRVEWQPA